MFKIGILREGKIPTDARAPLTPRQCVEVQQRFPVEIVIQPSPLRSYHDTEYIAQGIHRQEDLSDCDILLGVKEVPVDHLIPGKTYMFFSHTIKKQPHNRRLLQAVLENGIRLIDYEVLTDERGDRLVAFGFYAGIVGAHNGIWTYGQRTGSFDLPRMHECHDYNEVKAHYRDTIFPPMRIVLTGNGRVASGVIRNLHDLDIHQVAPLDFLKKDFDKPVFTQLYAQDYVQHRSGPRIFNKEHFYAHGEEYVSVFAPYARRADILMNAIYYDKKAPMFFTAEEMTAHGFSIQVIADISCDLVPDASVPCTIRASTIPDPVYGFDPHSGHECPPFLDHAVDVMAIDNLPSELPRDAGEYFGRQLIDNILPELLHQNDSAVIRRATIAQDGRLCERYHYLQDYVSPVVPT
jgi:saccharopine dehydrogenase (NAD+, L-lysine-forming)